MIELKPKNQKKLKKMGKGKKLCIIIFSIFTIGFIVNIVGATFSDSNVWNITLLTFGIIEAVAAIAIFKFADYREKYYCPYCSTRRKHHRKFIKTTEETRSTTKVERNPYPFKVYGRRTQYTHYFDDTYVCPKCGETCHREYHSDGGYLIHYKDDQILDHRLTPHEF